MSSASASAPVWMFSFTPPSELSVSLSSASRLRVALVAAFVVPFFVSVGWSSWASWVMCHPIRV